MYYYFTMVPFQYKLLKVHYISLFRFFGRNVFFSVVLFMMMQSQPHLFRRCMALPLYWKNYHPCI